MHKSIYLFFSMLVILGCSNMLESEQSLDNIFLIEGILYDKNKSELDFVNVKIMSINASEGHKSLLKVNFEVTTDINGNYSIGITCGTTFITKYGTDEKTYTKYIRSITLEFSKEGYSTLIKEFETENLEKTYFYQDITLIPLQQ